MTTIYVASYVTAGDFDCFQDDGCGFYDSIADMAHGYTCAVSADLEKVIEKAKAMLTAELIETEELTEDDELTYEVEEGSLGNRTITATCGVDTVAVIVIRPFED